MATIKPTFKDPISPQSQDFEKDFKKTMIKTGAPTIPDRNVSMNETNSMLSEVEQSLKKKIWSLGKMEALVFSDPKLSAVYEDMAENGEEKYGYHYNETIMNMLFNDYVLNSPKYLQKYKMAIPKEKKRRDKSGINQLKKAGEKKMTQSGLPKLQKTEWSTKGDLNGDFKGMEKPTDPMAKPMVSEDNEPITKVLFLVNERNPEDPDLFAYFPEEIHNGEYRTGYSHIGQHSAVHPEYAAESREATPEEYQDLKAELEGVGYNLEVLNGVNETTSAGSAGGAAGYVGYAGPAAWSTKGDLMGGSKKKGQKAHKPIWKGGTVIQETNYLTDPSGFEKYIQKLNEEADTEFIPKHSQAYGTVDNMSPENRNIIRTDIERGKLNNNSNIKGGIALQEKDNKINPKYSHFAVYKPNSKIINGWEYAGYDPEELKMEKKHYFFDDIVDMDFQPRDINILTAKTLQKRGINPFDINNWFTERYNLDEKSKSKSQQRFMGMVHAVKKGELSPDKVGDKVEKAADSMSMKDTEDFASTKHKGLPEKLDEFLSLHDAVEYVSDRNGENPFEMHGQKWQFVNAKYPDGKIDIGVYRYGQDVVYDYNRWQEEMGINENNIKEDMQTMIQNNGTSMSNKAQATGDMSSNVSMGTQATGGLNEDDEFVPQGSYTVSNTGGYEIMLNDAGDAARVRDAFGSDNPQTSDWLEIEYVPSEDGESEPVIDPNGYNIPLNQVMRLQEQKKLSGFDLDNKLLEEINKELEAFSIHHDKLKLMAEDKKTPSMVQGDRLRAENPKNFKKDMQNSDTKEIIDVEKELQWKDQQTDVGNDPQKLGMDIEKTEIKTADMKGDEALKNVGNSANNSGDEIPKRNLTTKEQEEVDLYRNGQHSLNYDNEPSERFTERMKADQGEFFEMGEKQKKFKADAPMYNKDTQPIEDANVEKVQFDKNVKRTGDKVAWNERMGLGSNVKLAESMITGRYIDVLGKRRLIEFRLGEVKELKEINEDAMKLSFDGLGNTYMSKTVDKKPVVNEGVVDIMENYQFYTDGRAVFTVKNPVQKLTEGEVKEKPVVNEQVDKMKHLLGYKPSSFVDTTNVKKNRKF